MCQLGNDFAEKINFRLDKIKKLEKYAADRGEEMKRNPEILCVSKKGKKIDWLIDRNVDCYTKSCTLADTFRRCEK